MLKSTRISIISIIALFVSASLLCTAAAVAQSDDKSEKKPRRRSQRSLSKADRSLLKVFEPITISARESTVKVQNGGRQIAVGTIVDSDGLILTKASEMQGDLKCRLPNGDLKSAVVYGIDKENDLALLKIDAEGLAVAPLKEIATLPTRGMWLASPTDNEDALAVGVVGVAERKIPPSRAFIGIQMMDLRRDGGVKIVRVVENSPAMRAKLRVEDVIVKIDDIEVKNQAILRETLGTRSPGSDISLTVKRDDEEMLFRLTLADIQAISPMNRRSRNQNRMGGSLSTRGKDFPRAFQHDTALKAKHCGGPVVDLDGQIVGINIARSGRVSSLAIPIDVVIKVIEQLKSGDYAPVKVYADRIESSKEALSEIKTKLASGEKDFVDSEKGYADSKARLEELERMKKDIAARIKEVYDERKALAKKKTELKSKNSEFEQMIKSLQNRLEAIKAGKSR